MPTERANWSEAEETARQLRRFLVVGLLCVATDLALYFWLANSSGLPTHWSKALSYLAGVIIGFVLNKAWTFRSTRRTWTEPVSYLLLYMITLAINVGCNTLVLAWLVDQKLLAIFFATTVTTIINFLGMKLVTFRKGIEERQEITSGQIATRHAA